MCSSFYIPHERCIRCLTITFLCACKRGGCHLQSHTHKHYKHMRAHTHTHTQMNQSHPPAAQTKPKSTCQTGSFEQRNGWVDGEVEWRRRRGRWRDRRPLKSRLKQVTHLILEEITHKHTHRHSVWDYGFHHLGGRSAHRRQDLYFHPWRLLHPRVCEFVILLHDLFLVSPSLPLDLFPACFLLAHYSLSLLIHWGQHHLDYDLVPLTPHHCSIEASLRLR